MQLEMKVPNLLFDSATCRLYDFMYMHMKKYEFCKRIVVCEFFNSTSMDMVMFHQVHCLRNNWNILIWYAMVLLKSI